MADRRLLVWALAAFHAAGFTLGVVLPAYASGGLSDALPSFGTVAGVVGYAYLWGLSYLATRWVLTEAVLAATLDGALREVLLRGSAAGGLVGLGALLGPLALVAAPELAGGGTPRVVLLFATVGAGVAVAVGVVIGFVFTVLDVAAVRIAGALVGTERRPEGRPTRDRR